jgi:hypothetical protein
MAMPIWIPSSLADQLGVMLTGWAAFKVFLPGNGFLTVHLVGSKVREGEVRVSSHMVKLDAASVCGVTSSGRLYRPLREPGLGGEATYVWQRWLNRWSADAPEEISAEALSAFLFGASEQ